MEYDPFLRCYRSLFIIFLSSYPFPSLPFWRSHALVLVGFCSHSHPPPKLTTTASVPLFPCFHFNILLNSIRTDYGINMVKNVEIVTLLSATAVLNISI